MSKTISLFLFSFLILTACGGNVTLDCESTNDGSGGGTVEPKKGCDISSHNWQDEVLYVCSDPLPFTEMNQYGFVQVGSFQLVNYRGLWVNSITKICFKSIGPTSLDTVSQINIETLGGWGEPVVLQGPWPSDGRICSDYPITVGAESVQEVDVFIASYPPRRSLSVPSTNSRSRVPTTSRSRTIPSRSSATFPSWPTWSRSSEADATLAHLCDESILALVPGCAFRYRWLFPVPTAFVFRQLFGDARHDPVRRRQFAGALIEGDGCADADVFARDADGYDRQIFSGDGFVAFGEEFESAVGFA